MRIADMWDTEYKYNGLSLIYSFTPSRSKLICFIIFLKAQVYLIYNFLDVFISFDAISH